MGGKPVEKVIIYQATNINGTGIRGYRRNETVTISFESFTKPASIIPANTVMCTLPDELCPITDVSFIETLYKDVRIVIQSSGDVINTVALPANQNVRGAITYVGKDL